MKFSELQDGDKFHFAHDPTRLCTWEKLNSRKANLLLIEGKSPEPTMGFNGSVQKRTEVIKVD